MITFLAAEKILVTHSFKSLLQMNQIVCATLNLSSANLFDLDNCKVLSFYHLLRCYMLEYNVKLNSLPNDKILDQSKLEGFADDK